MRRITSLLVPSRCVYGATRLIESLLGGFQKSRGKSARPGSRSIGHLSRRHDVTRQSLARFGDAIARKRRWARRLCWKREVRREFDDRRANRWQVRRSRRRLGVFLVFRRHWTEHGCFGTLLGKRQGNGRLHWCLRGRQSRWEAAAIAGDLTSLAPQHGRHRGLAALTAGEQCSREPNEAKQTIQTVLQQGRNRPGPREAELMFDGDAPVVGPQKNVGIRRQRGRLPKPTGIVGWQRRLQTIRRGQEEGLRLRGRRLPSGGLRDREPTQRQNHHDRCWLHP